MVNSVFLTILYEESFWVAYIEKTNDENYQVGKKIFYTEPTDREVFLFIIEDWYSVILSRELEGEYKRDINKHVNPKRKKRIASKKLASTSIVTKAHLAMKQEHELLKIEKKKEKKQEKIDNDNRKFQMKLNKKKEKHRGK